MIVQAGLFAPKVAPPPPQDPFYNRVTELDYFKAKLSGEVGFITVLVGPRNCGKSVSSAFLCWSALPGQRRRVFSLSLFFFFQMIRSNIVLTKAFYLLFFAEIVEGASSAV